jgi:hypothetical protein
MDATVCLVSQLASAVFDSLNKLLDSHAYVAKIHGEEIRDILNLFGVLAAKLGYKPPDSETDESQRQITDSPPS